MKLIAVRKALLLSARTVSLSLASTVKLYVEKYSRKYMNSNKIRLISTSISKIDFTLHYVYNEFVFFRVIANSELN